MLKGDLVTTPLPAVLRQLADGVASGCLHVDDGSGGEAKVFLRGGLVYSVQVAGRRPQLGARLVSSGALGPEALAEALEAQRTELQGWRLGELLVHLGYVDQPVVEGFVEEQLREAATELLRWMTGTWKFRVNERTREDVAPPTPVEDLLASLEQRRAQWDVITEVLHGPDAVPMLSAAGQTDAEMSIEPDAWSLLCKVDGVRSLSDLARECGFTLFEAGQVVFSLVRSGLLEVEEVFGPEATPDSVPVEAPEPVESVTSRLAAAFAPDTSSYIPAQAEELSPADVANLVATALRSDRALDGPPPVFEDEVEASVDRVSQALSALLGDNSASTDDLFAAPRPRREKPPKPKTASEIEREKRAAARAEASAKRRAADAEELARAQADLEAARAADAEEAQAELAAGHEAEVVNLAVARQAAEERVAAEEAARMAAEQEAARAAAEQEAAQLAAEEEAARIAAEEEAARIAAEQEAARLFAEEEAARLAAEEEAARVAAEQEAAQLAAEQEAARVAVEEETARIAAAEAEAARLGAEEEAARAAAEQETARLFAEEAARMAAEEEAARLAAEQEAARLAAEEEAARAVAEQEAARLAAEEEAARAAAEQEAARLAAEEQAAQLFAEEAARMAAEEQAAVEAQLRAAAEQQAAEEAARLAAEEEARQIAEAQESARRAAEAQERARVEEELRAAAEAQAAEAARRAAEADAAEAARLANEAAAAEAARAAEEHAEQARSAEQRMHAADAFAELSASAALTGDTLVAQAPVDVEDDLDDDFDEAPLPTYPPADTDMASLFRELSSLGMEDEPAGPVAPLRPPSRPNPASTKQKKKGLFGR